MRQEGSRRGLVCLIMAGGSGGHIFPALAVADAWREQGHTVYWLGSQSSMEAEKIPALGYPFYGLPVGRLRSRSIASRFKTLLLLGYAIFRAVLLIQKWRPDCVVGFGGFASGPGGLAALLCRKPLFIHEQNARMGWTNRFLSRWARHVFLGFSLEKALKRADIVGNPVRQVLRTLPPPAQRFSDRQGPLRFLIMGGSQGAQFINQVIPGLLGAWKTEGAPAFEIWHQTGTKDAKAVATAYSELGISAKVEPFIEDMAAAYAWADGVLARAGALTIAELQAVGLGGILIPYPHAVDDHQTLNAQVLVEKQAAYCLQQAEYDPLKWLACLREMGTREQLQILANRAWDEQQTNPAEQVVNHLQQQILREVGFG